MKLKLAISISGAVLMGVLTLAAQETKSQWDGVYTVEQATRGEELFADKCAACHGADLSGQMGPPLVGDRIAAKWNGSTLGGLLDQIRTSMPQGDPDSLTPQQYADALAFILHKNNYPAGTIELPTQTADLDRYNFLAVKPAGK